MEEAAASLGMRIAALGRQIETASTAATKVRLLGELALLVSQDAGGISFMTNEVHEVAGSAGLVPGTAAVLSMLVNQQYIKANIIPEFTEKDCRQYIEVIKAAVKNLARNYDQARSYLGRKKYFDKKSLAKLIF